MEKLDTIVLAHGSIIHFQGMPLQLQSNGQFLGRKENFEIDPITGFAIASINRIGESGGE